MPHRSSVPAVWRRYPQRYRLVGNKCETCGNYYFPPKTVCPVCRRKGKLVEYQFSGKGRIESYTVVYTPPDGMEDQAPYVLAIIKLDEGPMLTAQVVDVEPSEVKIGMPVELVFRRISEDGDSGLISYGYKFRPAK